jgi:hypothetical protein
MEVDVREWTIEIPRPKKPEIVKAEFVVNQPPTWLDSDFN